MYYQINRETQKMELIFSKEEYMSLSNEQKSAIKSNFLFSKSISGWVSRAKFPHLYSAERVAQSLGAENRGKVGESISFEEQMQRKAEKAEARAERMEYRSDRAVERAEALQKPINDMHGDIAFFTQPNISTSAGRAFTNRRNRMWEAYERGYEEFKKSSYYAERAETARRTAEGTKPTDKGFCERRIAEAQKTIKAQRKNLEHYEKMLGCIERGENVPNYTMSRDVITEETVGRWIENAEEIIEQAISKEIYYRECLEELGGIQFSKDNIKVGYIVKMKRWGLSYVVGTGTKFFTYTIENSPIQHKASYGEILEVVKAEEAKNPTHPFTVGEEFTVEMWNDASRRIEKTLCKIVKASDKTVTVLNTITNKTCVRTPKLCNLSWKGDKAWSVFMDDSYKSGFFKPVTN